MPTDSFFRDDRPRPEPVDPLAGHYPSPWLGGVVPTQLLVAVNEKIAVAITHLAAYPDGFSFTVESFIHPSVSRHSAHDLMGGRFPGEDQERAFRLGLEWPDGRRSTDAEVFASTTDPTHGLEPGGSGSSQRHSYHDYWAWPLPTAGELRIVVAWPAFELRETSATLDAALFAEALDRARPVWPDVADPGRSRLNRHDVMRLFSDHRAEED